MQAEQGRRTEGARNKRWWWEENEKLKCALPRGDLRKWPQIAQWHASSLNSSQKKGHALCLCFICCHDEAALERWQKRGGFGGGWMYGAAEEWLPGAELRDESQTGILFCQLECANGNVRAAGKLMNLIGEMPPLSPNAWSIAIVFCGCWSFFFGCCCFLWCYFLIVFSSWHGSLWLRVWWWTLSQGNKGIDPRQESMFSSVTYKSGCVWKVIFELKFPNSVSKVNVNKRGRVPPQ